jgi:hypothetical protein
MHFRLRCPWTEAKAEVFMDMVEDVVEDALKQEINLKKQKTSQSLHKIMARDG